MTSALLWLLLGLSEARRLDEAFKWWSITYEFDSVKERNEAIENRAFIKGNSLITSIARYGDKLFLATPRFRAGVPSTLNYINVVDVNSPSPALNPYPSMEMNAYYNRTSKLKKMVSIVSIKVDSCNRLWALDTGIVDDFGAKTIEALPSIFIFQLSDNTLTRKYSFKDEDTTATSKFRNIIVDESVGCDKSFAFIADTTGALIVYDWHDNKSYRVHNNYFSFEPIWGNLKTSLGNLHQVSDGVQGMVLGPTTRNGYRDLMFRPVVGVNEFSVSTKMLKNRTMAENVTSYAFLGGRGDHMQSTASFIDMDNGVLFYTVLARNGIACWNFHRGELLSENNQAIIETFDEFGPHLYPADLTIDSNGTLWVLTNRLLDYQFEKSEQTRRHFIFTGTTRDIIRNTLCDYL